MYPLEVGSMIMIAGNSGAGKNTIAQKLIIHKKVINCYNIWQSIYEDVVKLFPSVIFKSGLPMNDELMELIGDTPQHCLIFFDDMIHDIVNNMAIERLITVFANRYRVTSYSHNLYYHGKHANTLTLNQGSFILMASRIDTSQIRTFGRQVMGPGKGITTFWYVYEDTQRKTIIYYLLMCQLLETNKIMLRTFIFAGEYLTLIYRLKL